MRPSVFATSVAATLFLVVTPLLAHQPILFDHMNPYEAGACAAPGYGAAGIQPGCPQCERACCKDAWAGYCEKKHSGFCLPCIRPMPYQCRGIHQVAPCSNGCGLIEGASHGRVPVPAAVPETTDAAPVRQPTKAPDLAPAPPKSTDSQQPEKPISNSPSDATSMPFPVFNPAAWKIGDPIR